MIGTGTLCATKHTQKPIERKYYVFAESASYLKKMVRAI
jgi:hypothetical protein